MQDQGHNHGGTGAPLHEFPAPIPCPSTPPHTHNKHLTTPVALIIRVGFQPPHCRGRLARGHWALSELAAEVKGGRMLQERQLRPTWCRAWSLASLALCFPRKEAGSGPHTMWGAATALSAAAPLSFSSQLRWSLVVPSQLTTAVGWNQGRKKLLQGQGGCSPCSMEPEASPLWGELGILYPPSPPSLTEGEGGEGQGWHHGDVTPFPAPCRPSPGKFLARGWVGFLLYPKANYLFSCLMICLVPSLILPKIIFN